MRSVNNPLISIVMPVWNAAPYLREAIDSILNQSFREFELIAVDDGSTDESVSIIESYEDPRIRLIQQGRKGFVAAVNHGVAEARAEWIARHDADDISHPQRLESQWLLAKKHPNSVLIHCGTDFFGIQVGTQGTARFARTQALIALRSSMMCPVCVGAALIPKQAFLRASGYREEDFPAEDFAFASRLLRMGRFVGTPRILYRIRTHEGQISQVKREAQIKQTNRISLENCAYFFRTSPEKADALRSILKNCPEYNNTRHMLAMLKALTRFRFQSVELWMWAVHRAITAKRS